MRPALVGVIGYHNLSNFSVGPLLLPELRRLNWPAGTRVEEFNWGPIAIVQELQASAAPGRIVLLGARPSRLGEGTITVYRWAGGLPGPEETQARIAEAVTGVISLDNLLIVGQHFEAWPEEVFVVDVAPGPQVCGDRLRPAVARRVPEILSLVRKLAVDGPHGVEVHPLRGERLGLDQPREVGGGVGS